MSEQKNNKPSVIVALDYSNRDDVIRVVGRLKPESCRLKVGFELFSAEGPMLVRTLVDKGFDVFLDLKFHDIPNTVSKACCAAADLGVWMLSVHALGGSRMMMAAREAVDSSVNNPFLIAVTVLTSHSSEDLVEIGLTEDHGKQVSRLAGLAMNCGLDGVVCSGQEAKQLRADYPDSVLVTPGIRLPDGGSDDQRRTMTPVQALQAGASYLVIGRPITQALDPLAALNYINSTIADF